MIATRHWEKAGGSGLDFTQLGLGTAPLGNLYKAISEQDALDTMQGAWDAGLRYFDTAPLYGLGLSETRVNRFLRDKPRDEYVLSTKVGRLLKTCAPHERDGQDKWFDVPSRQEIYAYDYDGVMRSVEMSLERLGVDRIDILYAHDLDVFNHKTQSRLDEMLAIFMNGGYRALLSLRDQGVVSAFGAGVNEWPVCQWLTERGDFDIFLLAGRYTLLEQEALDTFLPLTQERGIGIVIGGPYNSGILATGARPGAYYNYDPAPQHILDRVSRIETVCQSHNVRLIDAALQFPLHHPSVVSVIPGGQNPAEMQGNLRALGADIPTGFWHDLKAQGLLHADAPIPQ